MIKKGNHLDGVEPINEKFIENLNLLTILKNKLGEQCEAYNYLKKLISNCEVYDKSGYSGNSVLICKNKDNNNFVIKISKNKKLYDEYTAYKCFYKLGHTSKPIKYFDCGKYQVMITEMLSLTTAGNFFNSYKEISKFFGLKLRQFHELDFNKEKFNDEETKLFYSKYTINFEEALANDTGLIYMMDYMNYYDIFKMIEYLLKNKEFLYKNKVLVHGDFNPNNIFISSNNQIKMIDFCDSGICNKHYDIFWTMFMIIIFSGILKEKEKIAECEKIFLDSYGREFINDEELLFFKYFACLYWKRHDEITRINIL